MFGLILHAMRRWTLATLVCFALGVSCGGVQHEMVIPAGGGDACMCKTVCTCDTATAETETERERCWDACECPPCIGSFEFPKDPEPNPAKQIPSPQH